MATLQPNQFSSYQLTDDEQLHGSILTTLQSQVIQNQIYALASQKLALEFDPEKPHEFTKISANLDGQIFSLQWLLDASRSIESQLAQFRANQTQA